MKCYDQVIREHQSYLVETKTWEEGLTSGISRNEEQRPSWSGVQATEVYAVG